MWEVKVRKVKSKWVQSIRDIWSSIALRVSYRVPKLCVYSLGFSVAIGRLSISSKEWQSTGPQIFKGTSQIICVSSNHLVGQSERRPYLPWKDLCFQFLGQGRARYSGKFKSALSVVSARENRACWSGGNKLLKYNNKNLVSPPYGTDLRRGRMVQWFSCSHSKGERPQRDGQRVCTFVM